MDADNQHFSILSGSRMKSLVFIVGALFLILGLRPMPLSASDLLEALPLTDHILMLHFKDGHVIHHKRGQARSDEKVEVLPLDVVAASRPTAYLLSSMRDTAYGKGRAPVSVYRKSKGTDFAWFVDKWENGHAVNTRPDHAKEHWLYLKLPKPMKRGVIYKLASGNLAANGAEWAVLFDERKIRSEALHVNLLGYVPDAPAKYGYVFQWMGDGGSLDLKPYEGRSFYLLDEPSGQIMFTGRLAFRASASKQETYQISDSPPYGNFLNADVYECDFSNFKKPGRYVLAVDGIGCSFPFKLDADVYREAFRTTARALYHNRSGIELKKPYTEFTRPAPHNPKLTPGFAGKLMYTTLRFTDWGSEGGDAAKLKAGFKGPLESCGWYQDAGDWDSYYTHLRVAQELLLAYFLAPKNFTDGELNIPESGNGLPDILDEAAWLPRFLFRLRHELLKKGYGSGGVGLRICGDAFGGDEKKLADGRTVGQGSWEDVDRTWVASGEDPWSTYRYAGAVAQLAEALERAGLKDPEGVDWAKEAVESYAWAKRNTRSGDEAVKDPALRQPRAYAAGALFRLTGNPDYEKQFAQDTAFIQEGTLLWDDDRYGPLLYALPGGRGKPDLALLGRIRRAVLATADEAAVNTVEKRALRWGGNFYMPMLCGQQTTPWLLEGAVGYALTWSDDPARAKRYLGALYTTCDYFLGGNSLNMTWVTGLGPRYPSQVFHMDAWYNGKEGPHPGIIPYGPWRKERDSGQGPWDAAWAYSTLYPGIDAWPGNERWFSNRCAPLTSEFTIHQNIAPAAALFGILCAPGPTGSP
jgi:hypothetical protein